MKLPNGHNALIDDAKLLDYSLNPHHEIGGVKARVFLASLGISRDNYHLLRAALLQAAANDDVQVGRLDKHGQRFHCDFEMRGPGGIAVVRAAWIVQLHEDFPRLVTCYVIK